MCCFGGVFSGGNKPFNYQIKNKQINILVEEQQQVFSSELLRRSRSNTKSFIDIKKKIEGNLTMTVQC